MEPTSSLHSATQDLPPPRKAVRKNHRGGKKKKRNGKKAATTASKEPELPCSGKNHGDVEEQAIVLELEREAAAVATTEVAVSDGKCNEVYIPATSPTEDHPIHLQEGASTKDGDDGPPTNDLAAAPNHSEDITITSESITTTVSTVHDMITAHEIGAVATGAVEYIAFGPREVADGKVEDVNTPATIAEEEAATANSQEVVVVNPSVEGVDAAVVDDEDVEKDSAAVEVVCQSIEDDFAQSLPYEVKPAPGKGSGMFATKRIPRGTRIIEEEALMVVSEMSFGAVIPSFAALEPAKRAVFMELAGAKDKEEVADLADCIAEAMDMDPGTRISMSYEDQAAVQMIFGANSFGIDAETSAIFPLASRMNHSCIPNVYHTWNGNLDRLTVHALRDITPGEELLTTYISAILTWEQRSDKEHLGNYGFVCTCPACDPRSRFFRRSVFRRATVVAIEERLALYFASISLRDAFARKTGPFTSLREASRCAQLRVNLLIEEGIINMEFVKWYIIHFQAL